MIMMWFESFANSKRYKTGARHDKNNPSLRALLIQKDTKHGLTFRRTAFCLRALLIQKDTKHVI